MEQILNNYGFFDFATGDGNMYQYSASEVSTLIASVLGNSGVLYEGGDYHAFLPSISGWVLSVKTGICFVKGHWGIQSSDLTFNLSPTASGKKKIVYLVAYCDENARKVKLTTVEGSLVDEGATNIPVPTINDNMLPICSFIIHNGVVDNFTDRRTYITTNRSVVQKVSDLANQLSGKSDTNHSHTLSSLGIKISKTAPTNPSEGSIWLLY